MDNVLQTNGVPLTVFGGAVPELAPEDLPEGASPFNQDCDFNPGSVFTRGGRQNQYTFFNQVITRNPTLGRSLPGAFAPNEVAWVTPQNIQNDTPGSYATATLNQGVNISNLIQFQQLMFNTPTTSFTASFNAPVTTGNTVVVSIYVHDPNGSVEGINLPSITDNKSQSATRIVSSASHASNNYASFIITQSSAVGGNQTYTFNLQTNAAGTLTASVYAVCMMEITGTSNALGADPVDQIFTTDFNAGGGSTNTINTVQNNEVLIAVFQQNCNNNAPNTGAPSGNLWPWTLPSGYWHNTNLSPVMQSISDVINNSAFNTFNWQHQTLLGRFLPTAGTPNAIVTFGNWGPLASEQIFNSWFTLKMTNANGIGQLGFLPTGVDSIGATSSPSPGTGISTITFPTITTNFANEAIFYFVFLESNFGAPTPVPAAFPLGVCMVLEYDGQVPIVGIVLPTPQTFVPPTMTVAGGNNSVWVACAFSIPVLGNSVPWAMNDTNQAGNIPGGASTANFTHTLSAGSTILVVFRGSNTVNFYSISSITNTVGDSFFQVTQAQATNSGTNALVDIHVWMAQNIHGGNTDITIHNSTVAASGGTWYAFEMKGGVQAIQPTPHSQVLAGTGYVNLPLTDSVLGLEVILSGHQTSSDPQSIVSVSLNVPGSKTITAQLPIGSDGTIVIGDNGSFSQWGVPGGLTAAMVSNQSFGVNIVASANPVVPDTALIYGAQLRFFVSPNPPSNFNYIRTYEQTDGEIDTIALDASGVLWDEDVDTNPTVFTSIFNSILPNTFAKSVTFNDIEYIAFSNLQNGTDVPRQWNGTNLDRISMCGPGAACNAAPAGGSGGSNITPIQNTKQAPKVQIRRIAWGASINAQSDSTPGNVLVVSLPGGSTHGGNPPLNMNVGDSIVLSNITNPFPLKGGGSLPYNLNNGPNANGTYTLLSSGQPIIGGGETDTAFTLQAPAVQYGYSNDFGVPPSSGWFYQDTIATVTLQSPLPNVGVGNQIQITGTGGGPPSGFDGTWTVLSSPNAVAMTINSVTLVGGVATYSFTLIPPSPAPTPGQLVSTLNVLNGSGIGSINIFNVQNVAIQSVSGGTFSINIPSPGQDIPSQPQGGSPPASAQVAGTIFTFDPLQIVNSGNQVTGGSIVSAGLVAVGQRKVCYSFLTRSGYITQPSPLNTFNITTGTGSITVSGLSPGPSNVIARIVFFTGANGGNFFYIPQTVNVTIPGQPVQINTATIVNDNTSTSATFSFSDAVLLSATAIDIPGNNLFNTIELGSCRGLLTYAQRMFAWSEQLKITNLRNLPFDGGYNPANNEPLGWTPDPTSGAGGSISFGSPVFGWAYFINNTTGLTQAAYGMITQPAWQDEFGVPIVQASTLYSVRITALCQPQPQSGGNLVVDLFSPSTGGGTALGTFSIPLSSMTTTMQIYTGTLLTNILQPVPKDLVIRIWAQNIAAGAQILIDRVEPFQTLVPVATTSLKGSYANNQEAFDLVTGVCGPSQNSQPINGAMELFDLLYALKEKSWFSTFDNGVTEPNKWNWKEVSNKVGTIGIHSYDWGEGWAVTANRQGGYFFEGGEPIKITQEIQPVWDAINWQYGYTIWMRNDPEQRRITIGIPIATPNQWMPEFPVNANPTSPNVVLMCNYRELNTGAALAQTGPIRSTFTGRLMSPEPARKWSFWNIASPYSDFISRANNRWPQFYCTGYQDSKIFALLASQLSDDSQAINSFWISYGFVKPEAADAKGLGLFRMEFPYFTVLATGSGTLNTYVYPESPFNQPYALDPTPLPTQSQGDLEIGVNIKGQRFFVRVGTNAVGAAFRCSKMVVPLIPDTWAPIRGYNVITA